MNLRFAKQILSFLFRERREYHFDEVKISRFAAGEIYHCNLGNLNLTTLPPVTRRKILQLLHFRQRKARECVYRKHFYKRMFSTQNRYYQF